MEHRDVRSDRSHSPTDSVDGSEHPRRSAPGCTEADDLDAVNRPRPVRARRQQNDPVAPSGKAPTLSLEDPTVVPTVHRRGVDDRQLLVGRHRSSIVDDSSPTSMRRWYSLITGAASPEATSRPWSSRMQ